MPAKNILEYQAPIRNSKPELQEVAAFLLSVVAVLGFISQNLILSFIKGRSTKDIWVSPETINFTIRTLAFIGFISGSLAIIFAIKSIRRRPTPLAKVAILVSIIYWSLLTLRVTKFIS